MLMNLLKTSIKKYSTGNLQKIKRKNQVFISISRANVFLILLRPKCFKASFLCYKNVIDYFPSVLRKASIIFIDLTVEKRKGEWDMMISISLDFYSILLPPFFSLVCSQLLTYSKFSISSISFQIYLNTHREILTHYFSNFTRDIRKYTRRLHYPQIHSHLRTQEIFDMAKNTLTLSPTGV